MTTPGHTPAFDVGIERQEQTLIARPLGELDLSTAPLLSERLREQTGFHRLVLDLRTLSFMDSTGLRLLVAEHERAGEQGYELVIVRGSPEVDRLLELTRMDQRLPVVDAEVAGV